MKGLKGIFTIAAAVLLASCEKEDIPVALPNKGEAEYGNVEMGEDYVDQVFFDLESGRVVHMSQINSWHLAFEASVDGYHVFMNGGASVFVYNTHSTDFAAVTTAPKDESKEWLFDRPCGLPDSTGWGDWRSGAGLSKNEVYIIKLNNTHYPNNYLKKLRIIAVSDKEYTIEFGDLNDKVSRIISIPKNSDYNYSYFSFENDGQVIQPDPPKDTWDIVFTRYRFIYYDMDNFPYTVNGVLLNPYKTECFKDTATAFPEMVSDKLLDMKFSNHRDVIGHNWKTYSFTTERYEVNKSTTYVIHNRNSQYWKMRFIDFYSKSGIKGNPSFEFQRVN